LRAITSALRFPGLQKFPTGDRICDRTHYVFVSGEGKTLISLAVTAQREIWKQNLDLILVRQDNENSD
jgi:hypothetical protein